jgi:heme O synthase-like polyprenyltransferase
VKKISVILVVAVSAFLMGLASASALNRFIAEEQAHLMQSTQLDPMGNVRANQD